MNAGGITTVKPPIEDTPKEDKPPNKGQIRSPLVYNTKNPPNEEQPLYKGQNAGSQVEHVPYSEVRLYTEYYVRPSKHDQ